MLVNEAITFAEQELKKNNILNSRLDSEILVSHLINIPRENIYFKLKVTLILTGTIVNLEDDMIQVKIINDFMKNQTLYINFNYQGIPENLKISYFHLILC